MLAPYACFPNKSQGRLYHESKQTIFSNSFARDRDYLICSNAFKRMQYKTQVFINYQGDHCRNRLTHSMEVASVARLIASQLRLSEDLAEIISLAHDLGHAPFGHIGENALNQCMKEYGEFSHNVHSFKIVTHIERQYPRYRGLNLSWETLSGIVKHNGPLIRGRVHRYILEYNNKYDLDLYKYASLEAQISSLADDITYLCHDLEDGLYEGLISVDLLSTLPLIKDIISQIKEEYDSIDDKVIKYETTRKLKIYLISDLINQVLENIKKYEISSLEDVYNLGCEVVSFSDNVTNTVKEIKNFLFQHMYCNKRIMCLKDKCYKVIFGLFKAYQNNLDLLPDNVKQYLMHENDDDINTKMSMIADYIAGMTDRFAIMQYEFLYNTKMDIRLL